MILLKHVLYNYWLISITVYKCTSIDFNSIGIFQNYLLKLNFKYVSLQACKQNKCSLPLTQYYISLKMSYCRKKYELKIIRFNKSNAIPRNKMKEDDDIITIDNDLINNSYNFLKLIHIIFSNLSSFNKLLHNNKLLWQQIISIIFLYANEVR